MLLSTKIIRQLSINRKVVARDWRVCDVPEEDASQLSVGSFFERILSKTYDQLDPLNVEDGDRNASIRGEIGSSQKGNDFQSISLTVNIKDAVAHFGLYIKYYMLCENLQSEPASGSSSVSAPA